MLLLIGLSVLSWIGVLPPEWGAPQPADKPVSTRRPARWPGQAQALRHWAHFGAAGGPHRWTGRNRFVCVWLPVCFHIHNVFIFFSTIKERLMIHSKNLPRKYGSIAAAILFLNMWHNLQMCRVSGMCRQVCAFAYVYIYMYERCC